MQTCARTALSTSTAGRSLSSLSLRIPHVLNALHVLRLSDHRHRYILNNTKRSWIVVDNVDYQ